MQWAGTLFCSVFVDVSEQRISAASVILPEERFLVFYLLAVQDNTQTFECVQKHAKFKINSRKFSFLFLSPFPFPNPFIK